MKIQCPAKINLDLKIINKRPDGFHNIESIMQTINLYDYLTINVAPQNSTEIILNGNCNKIPYNEKNLIHKATTLFLENNNISGYKIEIFVEKNIPVEAGLGGGSTDAAGTLYGLNRIFSNKLTLNELHELCAKLGSDLNVCLTGGKLKCTGRGEKIESLPFEPFCINLIKPENLGISAKEAYTKFSQKIDFSNRKDFKNDLEWAIINDYPIFQEIKSKYPTAMMTGSGSTYFSLKEIFKPQTNFWVKNGLKAINCGVCEI